MKVGKAYRNITPAEQFSLLLEITPENNSLKFLANHQPHIISEDGEDTILIGSLRMLGRHDIILYCPLEEREDGALFLGVAITDSKNKIRPDTTLEQLFDRKIVEAVSRFLPNTTIKSQFAEELSGRAIEEFASIVSSCKSISVVNFFFYSEYGQDSKEPPSARFEIHLSETALLFEAMDKRALVYTSQDRPGDLLISVSEATISKILERPHQKILLH